MAAVGNETRTSLDFRAVFEAAPAAYVVLTPDFEIVAASDAYLRATMRRREDIVGRPMFDVFPSNPADATASGPRELKRSLERVLDLRRPDAMPILKYDLPLPGGGFEERHWKVMSRPLLDARAEVAFILIDAEDVTEVVRLRQSKETLERAAAERRRIEAGFLSGGGELGALIRAFDWSRTSLGPIEGWPQSLRTAVDVVLHSPVPIVMLWGPEGVMIYNDAYSVFAGGRHPRLLGSPVLEGWPEVADFNRRVMEVGLRGETLSFHDQHLVLYRNDVPEDVWMDLSYNPIRDESGKPAGVLAIVVETTQRVRAETAMRESEERFRLIADSAPVPMWVSALGGRREFINQAYCQFLGLAYQEALTFDWRKALHPEDLQRILQEQVAGEGSRKPFTLEARYRGGDREWHWLRSESQPRWGPGGEHIGFIGVAYDVTLAKQAEADLRRINELLEERVKAALAEKDEAEERLRQAQKMEAVGQLTGGVAHDFNNLLTAIIGNIELLGGRVGGDDAARRMLQSAQRAAERGAKLTEQLLAFSRRQHLRPRAVDANRIIAGMSDLLARTIGGTIQVRTVLAPDLQPTLVDPTQIEIAILNLAINARDAMPLGGTITIATANVGAGARELPPELAGRDCVSICMDDTGAGMSEEVLARVFEPFYTTKEVGKGSGLGLSQVYGMVQQSGGAIRIDSRLGNGTTVRLYLPRAVEAALTDADAAAAAVGGTGGRILVVDDDPDVREIAAQMLRQAGYGVREVASGREALDALARGEVYDLLLVDIAMPGLNGIDTIHRARERWPGLRALFMTGYAEAAATGEAGTGSDPLIKKPFRLGEIGEAVREALRRPRVGGDGRVVTLRPRGS